MRELRRTKGIEIKELILITHGAGGVYVRWALFGGWLKLHRTVRWLGLNVPYRNSHVVTYYKKKGCNPGFQALLQSIAQKSQSNLKMDCQTLSKQRGWSHWFVHNDFFKHEISAGLCGVVASHDRPDQKKFVKYLEKPETKGIPIKTLTDGIVRLDTCLRMKSRKKVDKKFTILATNYWDSQMKKSDSIGSDGVRHWLHYTATKALETLVNGRKPDLMYTRNHQLELLYQQAEARRNARNGQ